MSKTLSLIKEYDIKWVDLRFTDTKGKEQHVSIPVGEINDEFFDFGKMFDGSSIAGWKGINESDMILMPDDSTAIIDPFTESATLNLRCDIVEPSTMQGYERDPRSVAKRAEEYLKSTGVADTAFFGPEPEFFVFDDVKWSVDISGASYEVNSEEAAWSSNDKFEGGNIGHRPKVKGGYFPVPPVDSLHDLRAAMCDAMEAQGLEVEVHHHEVGTAGQCEIGIKFNTLVKKADEVQILKYSVHNVAHTYGKRLPSCRNRWLVTMVLVCTFTCLCPRMVRTCLPVTAMLVCLKKLCATLAVLSSMPRRSMRLPMLLPTLTSA